MTAKSCSDFSDLDILLVDSDKFNQLFIQKVKSNWIDQSLSRIAKSPKHFQKLFPMLVNFVVDGNHPIWAHRALKWLKKIFSSDDLVQMVKECPEAMCRFVSYNNEVLGLHRLVDAALHEIKTSIGHKKMSKLKPTQVKMLDTGYVFIDDLDLNFGAFMKRSRKEDDANSESVDESDDFDQISIPSEEDLDEGYNIDTREEGPGTSEDDGVFDMDKGSLSSVADSHGSIAAVAATRPLSLNHRKSSVSEGDEKETVVEDVDNFYLEECATDDEVIDESPAASSSDGEVEVAGGEVNGESSGSEVSIPEDGRVAVQKPTRR